jgi:hypothetical protein
MNGLMIEAFSACPRNIRLVQAIIDSVKRYNKK